MSSKNPNRPRRSTSLSSSTHHRNLSAQKTEITINVYDLLPPGRLSSLLWTLGGSLLHSGIVINQREYAYGGHSKRGITGVYYTSPRFIPPGGTFRLSILQGFTFKTETEIAQTIKDVSDDFMGPSYNLLTHNCNHFTNALCLALTGKAAPAWLNRAASIGLALPCMVPREWISPPDVETADGELLEDDAEYEEEEDDLAQSNERSGMLAADQKQRQREEQRRRRGQKLGDSRRASASSGRRASRASNKVGASSESGGDSADERFGESLAGGRRLTDTDAEPPARLVSISSDSSGRPLPAAERAPVPKTTTATR